MQIKNVTTILRVVVAIAFIALGISIAFAPSEWASTVPAWARLRIFGSMKPFVQLVSLLHILTGMGIGWTKTVRYSSPVGLVLSLLLILVGGGSWIPYLFLFLASGAIILQVSPRVR